MNLYQNLEDVIFNNDYLESGRRLMKSFEASEDKGSVSSTKKFLTAQHVFLLISEHRIVQENLRKYGHLINKESLSAEYELKWIKANICYLQGRFPDCIALLHDWIREVDGLPIYERRNRLKYDNFLLCRVHLLAGKAFRRRHDIFMAKLHFGLSYSSCERSLRQKNELNGDHFLPGRIVMIYSRLYIGWRDLKFVEELLKKGEEMSEHFFSQTKGLHLFQCESLQFRGRYKSIKEKNSTFDDSPAREYYDKASAGLEALFKGRPHRRKARLKRLTAYHTAQLAYEQIMREGGIVSDESVREIKKALNLVREELIERFKFFGRTNHPTIVRAYNNSVFARTVLIRRFLQNPKEYEIAKKEIIATERELSYAEKLNQADGRIIVSNSFDCVDLSQKFVTLRRKMALAELRYENAKKLAEDRHKLYRELWSLYKKAYSVMREIRDNLSHPESQDKYFSRLHDVQEIMLKVINDYQGRVTGKLQEETVERAFTIFAHSRKTQRWSAAKQVNLLDPKAPNRNREEERQVKFFIREMMMQGRNTDRDQELSIGSEKHEDFIRKARTWIKGYDERIKANKKESAEEPRISSKDIYMNFTPGPGVIIAYFAGREHIFALTLYNRSAKKKEYLQLIRLTNKPFLDATYLKNKGRSLQDLIDLMLKHGTYRDLTSKIRQVLSPGLARYFDETTSHPNIQIIKLCRLLHQRLLGPIDLEGVKRIYTVPDKWMWNRVPFSMLLKDLPNKILKKKRAKFSDLRDCFVGHEYVLATMPSLQNIWAYRNITKQDREQVPKGRKKLPDSDYYYMTAFHTTDDLGAEDQGYRQYANRVFHRPAIKAVLHSLGLLHKDQPSPRLCLLPGIHPRGQTLEHKEKDIYNAIARSHLCLFQGHTRKMTTEYRERSLCVHQLKYQVGVKEEELKGPYIEFTMQEIAGLDLGNLFLAFVNSCSSTSGEFVGSEMPESLFSAFLDAGATAVIGTRFVIFSGSAQNFAKYFFRALCNNQNEHTTLGEARRAAIRKMLQPVGKRTNDNRAHPIRWGAYMLMGDMNRTINSAIRKELDITEPTQDMLRILAKEEDDFWK